MPWNALRRWRRAEAGLSVALALQIAVMFVAAPLAATGMLPSLVIDLLRLGLAAAAVMLVSGDRRLSAAVSVVFVLSLALSIVLARGEHDIGVSLERMAAAAAFDVALMLVVGRRVFGEGQVTFHRITGAVVVYLALGLVFANVYRACALLLHPSFSTLSPRSGGALSQMLYFSLTTLTTTGFGDIAPVHPFVRSLANLESVMGQLFPATLLARLVTLHAAGTTPSSDAGDGAPPDPPQAA